jgi:hypothetical protein
MEHAVTDWADMLGLEPGPAQVVACVPQGAVQATPGAALADQGGSLAVRGQHDRLRALEDDIYESNLNVVLDATRFRDIDPGQTEPPAEWVAELGEAEARKRLRVANGAWLGAKDAPLGISVAKSIVGAMAKARAVERSGGGRELNMTIAVAIVAPSYPRLEVSDG